MKILSLIIAASIALTSSSFAGKKSGAGKGRQSRPKIGVILKQYDVNSNRTLDGDELEKLKADYAKLAPLVGLDKDGDGTLGSDEIAAINEQASKRGGKAGKAKRAAKAGNAAVERKKKKNQ